MSQQENINPEEGPDENQYAAQDQCEELAVVDQPVPLSKLESNINHNPANPIHSTNVKTIQVEKTIPKTQSAPTSTSISEKSLTSNEEFYEASPVLEEDEEICYPSLLEETNYPTISVPTQPHMSKPLETHTTLNLRNIPIAHNPRSFPLDCDSVKGKDERALHKILAYEFEHLEPATSWWFRRDPWSVFIERDDKPDVPPSNLEEINLDQIFNHIYQ
ncbi:uncharacterized protein LODBEIA_P61400 [Lodderomyces beijingensis]|uniref:Uncharacterized protein n=1 Tax=Lodderomyces beijingensis TaxID=1775926 RepID=A0ABP0ZW96_9ASCO